MTLHSESQGSSDVKKPMRFITSRAITNVGIWNVQKMWGIVKVNKIAVEMNPTYSN